MVNHIHVTQITYTDPQPNGTDILENFPDPDDAGVDQGARKIYQILTGKFGTAGANRQWISTLDLVSCTETHRAEITLLGGAASRVYYPVAIPGSNYIVAAGQQGGVNPINYVVLINVSSGATTWLACNALGSGADAEGNQYSPRFVLAGASSNKFYVVSDIAFDFNNPGHPTSDQLTNTAFAVHEVDISGPSITEIAHGDKGPAKTMLYVSPTFVPTLGETFTFVMEPGGRVGSSSFFFVRILRMTNGTSLLPNNEAGAGGSISHDNYFYKISIADDHTFSSTQIYHLSEVEYIEMGGQQMIYLPDSGDIIYAYLLIKDPLTGTPLPGVDYTALRLIRFKADGSGLVSSNVIPGLVVPPNPEPHSYGIISPRIHNDAGDQGSRQIHRQPVGQTWAWGVNPLPLGDISAFDNTTLALQTIFQESLLDTRYNQPPFNSGANDAQTTGQGSYIDNDNQAIYACNNTTWDYRWERWTFDTWPGGPQDPFCFQIESAAFTEPVATGNQTITCASLNGDTPKAALLILGNPTALDTATAHIAVGQGLTDGTVEFSVATFATDGVTTIGTKRYSSSNNVIILGDSSSITDSASFVGFVENGITINWNTVSGTAHLGMVIFFSGPTLNVKAGLMQNPDVAGTPVTGLEFTPELIYGLSNFTKTGVDESLFGISQGVWFGGSQTATFVESPYAGADGKATNISSDQGTIDRAHFQRTLGALFGVDTLDGNPASPNRGSYSISAVADGFTITAGNGLSALKDIGWLALGFSLRARIVQLQWDLSDKVIGDYTLYHGYGSIEVLKALLIFPTEIADRAANANVGLGALTGNTQNIVVGRGSAALSTGTYEKTSVSSGILQLPSAVTGGSPLGLSFTGWTEGNDGWNYSLSLAPQPDRVLRALVIGRIKDCFPVTWMQAQIMEVS